MSWPKGPPHLALNPPYLFIYFFFPLLAFSEKHVFLPKEGHFCLFFSVSLCFSLAFFCLPPVHSLSLSLSLSISCSFLSSFLLCFLLLPCFCLFLYLSFFFAFVSRKEQHQNNLLQCLFSSILSCFLRLLSSFFFQTPFSYLSFFLIWSCALFNINVFFFKLGFLLTPIFGQEGGCNITLFYEPVLCKMWKAIVCFWPLFANFLADVQKPL